MRALSDTGLAVRVSSESESATDGYTRWPLPDAQTGAKGWIEAAFEAERWASTTFNLCKINHVKSILLKPYIILKWSKATSSVCHSETLILSHLSQSILNVFCDGLYDFVFKRIPVGVSSPKHSPSLFVIFRPPIVEATNIRQRFFKKIAQNEANNRFKFHLGVNKHLFLSCVT